MTILAIFFRTVTKHQWRKQRFGKDHFPLSFRKAAYLSQDRKHVTFYSQLELETKFNFINQKFKPGIPSSSSFILSKSSACLKPCALDRLLSKKDVTKTGNGKMKNGDKKRIGNEDTDRAWVQGRFYSPFFIFPFPYKGVSIQFFRCIPIFFNRLKSIFFLVRSL